MHSRYLAVRAAPQEYLSIYASKLTAGGETQLQDMCDFFENELIGDAGFARFQKCLDYAKSHNRRATIFNGVSAKAQQPTLLEQCATEYKRSRLVRDDITTMHQ